VIRALKSASGDGGMIAMDKNGTITMPYSTPTMLRGQVSANRAVEVIVDIAAPKP